MLPSLLSSTLVLALLCCIVANILIRVKMIAQINIRRAPGAQLSVFNRDFLGILGLHRLVNPKSPLRWLQILLIILSIAFVLGLTIAQNRVN